MKILCYGAGTNSTAMLVGLHERNIVVDLILFADTGGERPETYQHLSVVSDWCRKVGFPEIITVKKVTTNGDILTLEQNCLNEKMLPSIAYGYKSCSLKYKVAPQDKFVNNWPPAKEVWKENRKITKFIGYDFHEQRRAKIFSDDKYNFEYPLIEWRWSREDCIAAINRVGLPQPGKSACFFCPSSKRNEIFELRQKHPNLFDRAIALEQNAKENLTHIKGLGRNYSWSEMVDFSDSQINLFENTVEAPCDCYDGGDA